MTYWDTAQLSEDGDFRQRITAAAAQEGNTDPEGFGYNERWRMITNEMANAYASALVAQVPSPGKDPGVITDQMILSRYQQLVPPAA